MVTAELSKPHRIELILRQIDSLPTLPVIATRLLTLTSSDDSEAQEVIDLVNADPALTARVLTLCKTADRGIRHDIMTVDKAVVLLGFNAIRNAVLSINVFQMFERQGPLGRGSSLIKDQESIEGISEQASTAYFDRPNFWRHSLAVAILSNLIAKVHPHDPHLSRDEAFVCGLLHDIGKLAMDHVLPKSYMRVVELAELNQGNICEFERQIVGIDHHTAGKRLAEQWQLPQRLQDCIWLHGAGYDTLPQLAHRRLIGLIGLSDMIVRRQHIGYSGNFSFQQDELELISKLDFQESVVRHATAQLHDELEVRSSSLGLDETPSCELFHESIQTANMALGRLNHILDVRGRTTAVQAQMLEAITSFHATIAPGQSVQDVLDNVVGSARSVFGPGFFAMLYCPKHAFDRDGSWLMSQYSAEGRLRQAQYIEAAPHAPDLSQLDVSNPLGLNLLGVWPWIVDYLLDADDLQQVRMLPLGCGWATAAVLLHDGQNIPGWDHLSAVVSAWGASIMGAAQHDGARRLGEQLAEANRALAQTQDRLLRTESLASLGEMAAGAAHEMNNPMAVISGRSQLLSMTLDPGSKAQVAAQTIYKESHRLSDLITCLHEVADPPRPNPKPTDLEALLDRTIKQVKAGHGGRENDLPVFLQLKDKCPHVNIDGEHLQRAIEELLLNALQAHPGSIQVSASLNASEDHILIDIADDGQGMDEYTLGHALDLFFSVKAAGRRVGMGLPRAQQLIASLGGQLQLRSQIDKGTVVSLTLPFDSANQ